MVLLHKGIEVCSPMTGEATAAGTTFAGVSNAFSSRSDSESTNVKRAPPGVHLGQWMMFDSVLGRSAGEFGSR